MAPGLHMLSYKGLKCLINIKRHKEIAPNCLNTIELHQMLNLKSISNNTKLREVCKNEIGTSCSTKGSNLKIVYCLAEAAFQSKMKMGKRNVSDECQKELNSNLLEVKENIKFDEELEGVCSLDLKNFCSNIQAGLGNS